jgi:hypothetical protein
MAIFASTTTSGYSDPLKALSIKALEQRLKDQQAQMAAQQPDAAMMATIPGGIGHVLGKVADRMDQGRNEQMAAEGRNELAATIAQGPKGADGQWAPEQLAVMSRRDPEFMSKLVGQQHERGNLRITEQGLTGRNTDTIAGQAATNAATNASAERRTAAEQTGAGARNDATIGSQQKIASEGNQLQIDLAEKKNQFQRLEAIADRNLKVAEAEKDRVHATGTQDQKDAATAKLAKAQSEYDQARDAANNAAKAAEGREGRAATASEGALERAARLKAQETDLAFKGTEGTAERGLRRDLQAGQNVFSAGESAAERALREKLQGNQIAATATEGDKSRTATATNLGTQIAATASEGAKGREATKDLTQLKIDADLAEAERQRVHATGTAEQKAAADIKAAAAQQAHELARDAAKSGQALAAQSQGEGATAAIATAKIESDQKIAAAEAEAKAKTLATDPKRAEAVKTAENDYRKALSHIDNLEEATKILQHPKGIYTGAAQSLAPIAGGLPGGSMIVDKEKAQNTARYNTIAGEDAIRDMATTLKGSSTNYEMGEFKKMKNDPNISDTQRAAQLQRVVKAARADLEAQAKEVQAIGGDVGRIDRAMRGGGDAPAAPAAVDPLEGKTATGPDGKIIRRNGKWEKL